MKEKSATCMFKKIDVRKSEVLRAIKKSKLIWAVVSRIGRRKWCIYGVIGRKQKEEQ